MATSVTLSFCEIRKVNNHIAVFKVFPKIESLSASHLEELDSFMKKEMSEPYSLISDSREADYSLDFDAITHAREHPKVSVIATVTNGTIFTDIAMEVVESSLLKHRSFTDIDQAISWVKRELNLTE